MASGINVNIEKIRGQSISDSLESADIFIEKMPDFDWENDSLFLLDASNGEILEFNVLQRKLVRHISRKGQGPAELMAPCKIRVRNEKIFVLDEGNRALKVFDSSGVLLTIITTSSFDNPYFYRTFDVNPKDEIFIPDLDLRGHTLIGVYDLSGRKIRSLVEFKINENDILERVNQSYYGIGLADDGIYLDFPLLRQVWRCSYDGRIIWKAKVENELLNKAPGKDGAAILPNGRISMSGYMRGMEITPDGEIMISHYGGGCLIDENGALKRVLQFENWDRDDHSWLTVTLGVFRCHGDTILGAAIGQSYWLQRYDISKRIPKRIQ
jgi:hypothetical protein